MAGLAKNAPLQRFAFEAGDGFPLRLTRVAADCPPGGPPVLLVHGAGVRRPIGLNPSKTIAALAERACALLLEER